MFWDCCDNSNDSNSHSPRCIFVKDLIIENEKLKLDLLQSENKINELNNEIQQLKNYSINNLESVKLNIQNNPLWGSEWRMYTEWCSTEQKELLSIETANRYIKSFSNTRTANKKKSYIKNILTSIMRTPIKLLEIVTGERSKEIISMNEETERKFLNEQSKTDKKAFLISLLAFRYALRMSSVSRLKIKHLKFLKTGLNNQNTISLFYCKSNRTKDEFISKEIQKLLIDQIQTIADQTEESYVFDVKTNKEPSKEEDPVITERRRANTLTKNFNSKLKKSEVIRAMNKRKITSKIFRNTCSNLIVKDTIDEALRQANERLGHKNNSSAVNSYVEISSIKKEKFQLKDIVMSLNSNEDQLCSRCNLSRSVAHSGPNTICNNCNNEIDIIVKDVTLIYFDNSIPKFKIEASEIISNRSLFKLPKSTETQIKILQESLVKALIVRNIIFDDNVRLGPEALYLIRQESENIQTLNKVDLEVFFKFKENSSKCIYAPVVVEWSSSQGYVVKAQSVIPTNTIICEYSGIGMTSELAPVNDDSTFTITNKEDGSPGIVISPFTMSNIGRFLSGINNDKRRNGNVNSIKFKSERGIHIVLYTRRKILKNELLNYDYNGLDKDYPTWYFDN